MPSCLICQTEFESEEEVVAHIEEDHASRFGAGSSDPPKSPWEAFGLDQAAELVLPMLQEYMNNAAHSSAALKLTEIAVQNNQAIDKVLEKYSAAMKALSED